MVTIKKQDPGEEASGHAAPSLVPRVIALGLTIVVAGAGLAYWRLNWDGGMTSLLPRAATTHSSPGAPPDRSPTATQAEVLLTHENIDRFLDTLDQAIRRKDLDGVLRLIAPDAVITIQMKQGTQQQTVTLTRDEYRKTLEMSFAFPSANDYARAQTAVSLAPDERSAKVSYKSTETLRQAQREVKIEGEGTLILRVRGGKPIIVSLEQTIPGDST
jgi:ketosteroid isomerase-like protein